MVRLDIIIVLLIVIEVIVAALEVWGLLYIHKRPVA